MGDAIKKAVPLAAGAAGAWWGGLPGAGAAYSMANGVMGNGGGGGTLLGSQQPNVASPNSVSPLAQAHQLGAFPNVPTQEMAIGNPKSESEENPTWFGMSERDVMMLAAIAAAKAKSLKETKYMPIVPANVVSPTMAGYSQSGGLGAFPNVGNGFGGRR